MATVAATPWVQPRVMDARGRRSQLLDHPLLRGIRTERLEPILDGIAVKQVQRGTQLNTPEVTPGLMYLVLSGRLRAYQVTVDGHELLLELIPEGGFDGLLSVAGRRGHFTEADEDSVVASLALPTLERLISLEPRVAMNLMQLIVERLEGREEHLEAIVLHDPTQRLARQLLALGEMLSRKQGARLALKPRITHQMLADMLGVRRETVTLHLGRLTELGAVSVEKGRLLLDPAMLKSIVEDPDHVRRRERS
jgi:CRP/FNR family transcriptional regulator